MRSITSRPTSRANGLPLGSDRAKALIRWAELEGRTETATFADLFRWYMTNAKLRDSTGENYDCQGAQMLRVFGAAPPDEIKPEHIATYRDKCPRGCANVRLGIIKSVYAAAVEKGLASSNPAREVKRLKVVRRDRYITDDEFIAIREIAPDYLVVAMDIAYLIGCRPIDVCRLKWSDVTTKGVVLRALKTGKGTLFEMTPELQEALDRAKQLPAGAIGPYVIHDYRGQPYRRDAMADAWRKCVTKLDIENAQFRDLRAKNASDDPDGAQKRLQHSTPEMTKTYLRKMPVVLPISRRIVEGSTKK